MAERVDITFLIGGDAGQGVESGGAGFALAAARAGLHVFAAQDYRSRVRGGHNFYQVRVSDAPIFSHTQEAQLLLALTPDTVSMHLEALAEGAAVIFPEGMMIDEGRLRERGVLPMPLPLAKLAAEHGSRLMVNTGALAAAAAVVKLPLESINSVIRHNFEHKGTEAVSRNLAVAEAAYDVASGTYGRTLQYKIICPKQPVQRLLMNGNQAIALGALAGGCRFISAYPMTPATSIFEWLASLRPDYGVVAKHTEDEIAAVCMAIGASFAGARAMTTTSGGGFCLMVEAMGLAGMTEVPIVIVDAQRGGPSTGLPTRTEQSDLLFAVHAGHGEFPRIVLAPATVEECFEAGWRAFNLAEKYQCPVVILTDTYLATSMKTVESAAINFEDAIIDRGDTLTSRDPEHSESRYARFKITDSGMSPRAFPGHPYSIVRAASDEHDEHGHISEDAENRVAMMSKRMRKLAVAEAEMRGPECHGPQDAEVTLVCWGSTFGPCLEAARLIRLRGGIANVLKFADMWPLSPGAVEDAIRNVREPILVEQNFTSQLGALLRMTAGIDIQRTLTKFDGRPFGPEEIADAVLKVTANVYA